MRLLNITDRIPYPAITGAPLRTYNLLRRLAKDHEIHLAGFVDTLAQSEGLVHLRELFRQVVTAPLRRSKAIERPKDFVEFLFHGIPPDLRFYYSKELAQKIRNLVSEIAFDIVVIEHSHMGLYLKALPPKMWDKAVWVLHDIDFHKYFRISRLEKNVKRRMRLLLHSLMLRWWKPRFAEHFALCITVSESDRQKLLAANPSLTVEVSDNGVDCKSFQLLLESSSPPSLVFVGNMDYVPNIDAVSFLCRQILPRIRRHISNVEVWIVGANPRSEVFGLSGNGVHVTGEVEDVIPYYARSTISVAPLRAGGGTRLKILESMALGRAVVSTSIGCEGLKVINGQHILISDDAENFAERTLLLLSNIEVRHQLVTNARRLVESEYDWDVIAKRLVGTYQKVIR
jgi:sugar transferase (PEP-CTERM/EpsH1 system associated)